MLHDYEDKAKWKSMMLVNIANRITSYNVCYTKLLRRILAQNLAVLGRVAKEADCHILLAQKAFSMFALYPQIGETLSGTTASGLYEAKLGFEEMGKENHIFSPAYTENDIDEIIEICDHIVFNSFGQWQKFKEKVLKAGKSCGMRVNPECRITSYNVCYTKLLR